MKKQSNNILLKVVRNTAFQHAVFWIIAYYILLNIFSQSSAFQPIDFIYTAIFLITLAIPVMLNLYLFIPLFLRKGHYLAYILSFLILLFLFAWFNQGLFARYIDYIFPSYFFISFYTYWDLLKFFLVFQGITTLLQLSREWFELNAASRDMLALEKEKIDAELKALANQVNPHFLFNSLNVIYSLVVQQRKESPEAILKLSDILRYVIYGSSNRFVAVRDEIQLIHNYIDLQRFRVGEDSRISFEMEGRVENQEVAPMLLLPLVENGFKHGIKGDVEGTFLDIYMGLEKDALTFKVENNKGPGQNEYDPDSRGVGLENIRNRLGLLYPGKHEFNVEETDDVFRVSLVIKDLAKRGHENK